MTNRFQQLFSAKQKKIFVPFFTLGYPSVEESFTLIKTVIDAGAGALELGVPFSDPIADGPVIQKANECAIASGCDVKKCVALIARIREYSDIPVGLLLYYNLLFRQGEALYAAFQQAGVDAILVVDLPPEESQEHERLCHQYNLGIVPLIAMNTSIERARHMMKNATAYAYVVSRHGVTGANTSLSVAVEERVKELSVLSPCPLMIGFGLSTAEHVNAVFEAGAQGAIIGSAIVKKIMEAGVAETQRWLRELMVEINVE